MRTLLRWRAPHSNASLHTTHLQMPTYSIVPIAHSADKHLALVERIRANLADLYETGRWKLYYSEAELLAQARELASLHDKWAAISERARQTLPALEQWTAPSPDASPDEPTRLHAA
jgi:hypothetical protein